MAINIQNMCGNGGQTGGGDASKVALTRSVTFGDTESDNVQDALEAAADEMEKKISEEDIDEIEVVTAADAKANIASDNKLITPAAVQALIDRILVLPIELQAMDNFPWDARKWDATRDYNVGDAVMRTTTSGTKIHICTNSYVHDSSTSWSHYAANFDNGTMFATLPDGVSNISAYIPAIERGNGKILFIDKVLHQSTKEVDHTVGKKSVSFAIVLSGANYTITVVYDHTTKDILSLALSVVEL